MFVAPNNQIKEFREITLTKRFTSLPVMPFESILVNNKYVVICLIDTAIIIFWVVELNLVTLECYIKSFIINVSNAIDRQFDITFFQQDRVYSNVLNIAHFSKIVNERADLKLVHSAYQIQTNWSIMIPMDAKDWHFDCMILARVVCLWIIQRLKSLSRLPPRTSKNILFQDLSCF